MNRLHVFVTLVAAFIVANTACQKENVIQQEEALKKKMLSMQDSTGTDTLKPPCDSFPHDSFPHDTFPHDTFPHDSFPWPPHDTTTYPPHDTIPHDSFPWPDTIRYRRS